MTCPRARPAHPDRAPGPPRTAKDVRDRHRPPAPPTGPDDRAPRDTAEPEDAGPDAGPGDDAGDLRARWSEAVRALRDDALSPHHAAWLDLTQPLALVGDAVLLAAPNEFAKDVLENRIRPHLVGALSTAYGRDVQIAVVVQAVTPPAPPVEETDAADEERAGDRPRSARAVEDDDELGGRRLALGDSGAYQREGLQARDGAGGHGLPDNVRALPGTGRDQDARGPVEPPRLNAKYMFETFVIGNSNRFAHAAAVAVAEAPARAYNPLFVYGESGLGKTHLLHAIGHYAVHLFAGARVRYVSTEEFTNEFINSLRDDKARGLPAALPRRRHPARSTTSSSWRTRSARRRSSSTPSTRCTTPASRSSSPPTGRRSSSRRSRTGCAPASSGA